MVLLSRYGTFTLTEDDPMGNSVEVRMTYQPGPNLKLHNHSILVIRKALDQFLSNSSLFRKASSHERKRLLDRLEAAALTGGKLHFLCEWGLGKNVSFGEPDLVAISHIEKIVTAISSITKTSTSIMFLLTDTHAQVNGIDSSQWGKYGADVRNSLSDRGHDSCFLSSLISQIPESMFSEDTVVNAPIASWGKLTEFQQTEMVRRANRCSNGKNAKQAAQEYFDLSRIERAAIAGFYPQGVFITYHTPTFNFLLPSLPTIYSFVSANRNVLRPWFRELKDGMK